MANDNTVPSNITGVFDGQAGAAQASDGITTKAFLLNLAVGFGLFAVELSIFFLLKSSNIGRRILYVQDAFVGDAVLIVLTQSTEDIPRPGTLTGGNYPREPDQVDRSHLHYQR